MTKNIMDCQLNKGEVVELVVNGELPVEKLENLASHGLYQSLCNEYVYLLNQFPRNEEKIDRIRQACDKVYDYMSWDN